MNIDARIAGGAKVVRRQVPPRIEHHRARRICDAVRPLNQQPDRRNKLGLGVDERRRGRVSVPNVQAARVEL